MPLMSFTTTDSLNFKLSVMNTATLFPKPTKQVYFDSLSMIDYMKYLNTCGSSFTKINHIFIDEVISISIIPDSTKFPAKKFWPDGKQVKE